MQNLVCPTCDSGDFVLVQKVEMEVPIAWFTEYDPHVDESGIASIDVSTAEDIEDDYDGEGPIKCKACKERFTFDRLVEDQPSKYECDMCEDEGCSDCRENWCVECDSDGDDCDCEETD